MNTGSEKQRDRDEKVVEREIERLHDFKNHPFKVQADSQMKELRDSISKYGILNPLIVRPRPEGFYEVISGHRRKYAAMELKYTKVPVIIRYMLDEEAIISMVDSNLQRENILPSERAWAFKMKLDAMKHQGSRADRTSTQVVEKLSAEQVGEEAGMSRESIRRYIRLTNLIPEVLDMVDNKEIAFNPAVELSFLKPEEQKLFLEAKDAAQTTPSLSKAQRLKKLSQDGECTLEKMCDIMDEVKKGELDHVTIKNDVLRKYFPKSYTPKQMENTIIRLLEQWQRKKQRDQML